MIDQEAFKILSQLPKLPFGKLLTPDPAELSVELPIFTYSKAQAFDLTGYRTALGQARADINQLTIDEDVRGLYLGKLDELELRAAIVDAVKAGDDQVVTKLSLELYGINSVVPPLVPTYVGIVVTQGLAREFTEHLSRATSKELHRHKNRIDARAFVAMAKERLQSYGITNWRVLLSPRPLVQTGHAKLTQSPILRVPKDLLISRARARRLLVHEIDVHILRAVNGERSPLLLLGRGLAGYSKIEEGLAIFLQHLGDKVPKKLRPGFWQAWTIALLGEAGWSAAYRTLLEARLAIYQATGEEAAEQKAKAAVHSLLLRATRGITKPQAGVFFARDYIYRAGYEEVEAFVAANGKAALKELFVGKVDLRHLALTKKLGLSPRQLPNSLI